MTSARTSGSISGATQGAVFGSMIFPGVGTLIGAGAGFILGGISGASQDASFANQQAWQYYGAEMNYLADMHNIESRKFLAGINAMFALKAGEVQSKSAMAFAEYNAANMMAANQYNRSLLELDLERLWEDQDLDLEQLRMFKERETGLIVSDQAASGTVIGEGSNAEVVISQLAQRELDKVVIMHNANRQAADIANKMTQGSWQTQVAINDAMYQGQLTAFNATANARIQAASGLITNAIQTQADLWTAGLNRTLARAGISQARDQYSNQNQQNMIAGLFSAAGSGAQMAYMNRTPTSAPVDEISVGVGTPGYTGGSRALSSSYRPRARTFSSGSSLAVA